MNIAFHLILLLILMSLNAFLSATETALFSLNRIERRRLLEQHPRWGRLVDDLLTHPRRALVTLLIGVNIVQVAAAAVVTLLGLQLLGPSRMVFLVAGFTVALIFFGEILPKIFAVRANEPVALVTAPFIEFLAFLLYPVRRLVQWLGDLILGLILPVKKKESAQLISGDELRMLVKIGEEEGIIDRDERRMIQKLFELGERPVRSIMTPRTDLIALRLGEPWEKQVETMKNFHFTHFPVYQETLDQILGVVSTQDVILSLPAGGQAAEAADLAQFIKPVHFVPDSKRIDDLLREFQKTGNRFAVCVDEFGGTAGLVTLEDILEEIFGEFYDEYARADLSVRPAGSGEFLVDGKISLSEFSEFFKCVLEAGEAQTLSGYLMEKMGRVPRKNDVFEDGKFNFKIYDMARQRIVKILVRPLP